MQKLFIIDAVNLLFRSYHAIGPMTGPDGQSTGALFGFIRSIYKLAKDFFPDGLVAVFDGPDNKASRTTIYREYKSHRAQMPEDLFPQLSLAEEFCDISGIPRLTIPGVEADDTMGSIAVWAAEKGMKAYICTSDKDLCQLVNNNIHIIHLHKDNAEIDPQKVQEIFGVRPDQIVDLIALMGDSSDNIPGIKGIGKKSSVNLLQKFDHIDGIFQNIEKIPGKAQREALKQEKEVAFISRKLATLHLDVPFPREEMFFHRKSPDLPMVRAFYKKCHFFSLLREIESHETDQVLSCEVIDEEPALIKWMQRLQKEPVLAIDTATTESHPIQARVLGISLCARAGEACYIPMNGALGKEKVLDLIRPLFVSTTIKWIGHDIKHDMHALFNEKIVLSRVVFDTILAAYLLAPQNAKRDLDTVVLEKLGKKKIPLENLVGKGTQQRDLERISIHEMGKYFCENVDSTIQLYFLLQEDLKKEDLEALFYTVEMPLISVLFQMERRGVRLDLTVLAHVSKKLRTRLSHLEAEIYSLVGKTFNLNSPKQLSDVLFTDLGIRPVKKTAHGFSTRADVLEALRAESPVIEKILEYRSLEKLRTTYVDALPRQAYPPDHVLHCTFNQSVTATGRLSCQNPNLQNIPVRTPEGREIRRAFIPSQTNYLLLSADYSQIELRILAHLSEDPALISAFREGEDVHAYTASLIFGVPIRDVSSEMRYRAKAVNFGVLYGQGPYGLSQQLGISQQEATEFITTYFRRYPKAKEFLEFCKESARKTGKVVTLTGRQRPIPDIHSKNPTIRALAERLAINTPLQGAAADLIKLAMIELENILNKRPALGKMLLQIHDELLLEGPHTHIEQLGEVAKKSMEGGIQLKVPLLVNISIGKNWGEC